MAFVRRLFVSVSKRNKAIGCNYFSGRRPMTSKIQLVDHTAIKVNQIMIIILNTTAFIFDEPRLAMITALFLLAGTFIGKPVSVYYSKISTYGIAKPES
jgi:hypothetical protein